MLYEIKVPEAGFSITEGTVVQWHKNVGEKVQEGETIVSVETDKVVVEIPARYTGVLIEIKHEVGEIVPIGAVLGMIQAEGEEKSSKKTSYASFKRRKRLNPKQKRRRQESRPRRR